MQSTLDKIYFRLTGQDLNREIQLELDIIYVQSTFPKMDPIPNYFIIRCDEIDDLPPWFVDPIDDDNNNDPK